MAFNWEWSVFLAFCKKANLYFIHFFFSVSSSPIGQYGVQLEQKHLTANLHCVLLVVWSCLESKNVNHVVTKISSTSISMLKKQNNLYLNVATVLCLFLYLCQSLYCTSVLTLPRYDVRAFLKRLYFLILLCSVLQASIPTLCCLMCLEIKAKLLVSVNVTLWLWTVLF